MSQIVACSATDTDESGGDGAGARPAERDTSSASARQRDADTANEAQDAAGTPRESSDANSSGSEGSAAGDAEADPSSAGDGEDSADPETAAQFDCPEVPTAYVFENEGSTAARTWLAEAGFEVEALPLDQSPWKLRGAIVLGSGVSEHPEYEKYVDAYASDLYNFVDKANVLVQLRQDAEVEAEPPFLPSTHGARRAKGGAPGVRLASPGRSLVYGFDEKEGLLRWPDSGMMLAGFGEQDGFEVLLEQAESEQEPLLMEGAYGQGRIVLSQLPFDAADSSDSAQASLAESFFLNLLRETNKVCHRNTEALAISAGTLSDVMEPGSSVIAVLPDTQVYALRYPGVFSTQTSFLSQNGENLDIKYVFHLGDIVNNNTELEWQHAAASMSLLHGRIPYAIVPGNHDYGPSGDASTRDTLFNDYFRTSDQSWHDGFGGVYEAGHLDNSYHLFSIAGHDYVVLALEWGPRDEVLAWANTVMDMFPDRLGMLITHAYLNNNNRRYDHTDKDHPQDYNPHEYATPDVNDGEEIWQELVRHHPFVLTVNGHVLGDGAGYLESETDRGTTCHQMLVNYQMRTLGGEGYLRLLEFPKGKDEIRVWSYSPLYDEFLKEEDQEFVIAPFPG